MQVVQAFYTKITDENHILRDEINRRLTLEQCAALHAGNL